MNGLPIKMAKVKRVHIGFIELTYFELVSFLIIMAVFASWFTVTTTLGQGLAEVTSNQLLSEADQQSYVNAFMASFLLFSSIHIIIALLLWLSTRYVTWTLITGKPFDTHHLLNYFIHATPFVLLQIIALLVISRFGNFILTPVLANITPWSLMLAFALVVILINPLLIIVGVFGASAFFRFFSFNETKYFGFYLFYKKAKHAIDWGKWQTYVLRLIGLFGILNIGYLGVAFLPARIQWFLITILFVMFLSWSKLYLVKKEAL